MASLASFVYVFLLALPILYVFLLKKKTRASEEPELPPGPAKLPVIGNLHQLASAKNLHRRLRELSLRHGPLIHLKLGQVSVLVVSSAEMAKEVLKTHDAACVNRPPGIAASILTYGNPDMGFAPYGERWKQLRRICMEEFFSNKKVASLRPVIEEEICRAMRSIASRTNNDSPVVDVSRLACLLINDIICQTAFGSRYEGGSRENDRLRGMLKQTQALFSGVFLGDYIPLLGFVDVLTGMQGTLRKTFLELDCISEQLIKEHESNGGRGIFLDALLHAQKDAKNLTENEIKALLIQDVFMAGRETSSSILEWAMTELIRHPEAMRRVQDEVRSCVGIWKGKVEETDLCRLLYLKAVIKETMRLHPPAPLILPRESIRGFKLKGYDVAPKTSIFVNVFAIGRDSVAWERPDEFIPERLMGDSCSTIDLRSHHDFKLLPFGEWRRICPGMNLGLLMTELVLANLLYCFDWSLPAGVAAVDIDMDEVTGISTHRSTTLCLVATKYHALDE